MDRQTGEREAVRLIDEAAGVRSGATVLSTDPWTARMQIVDRMRRGRVFLAGDAAHLNPPFGGHGLNTGLGDAVDLGWKLAARLDGWGGPVLLDTYQIERRPIQERVIREATANMRVTSRELLADNLDDDDVGRGARAARGRRADPADQGRRIPLARARARHPDRRLPGHRPRTRPRRGSPGALGPGALLPHAWLGAGRSLYDELGHGFTLLRRPGTAHVKIEKAARTRGVPLKVLELPGRDPGGPALALIRPDQYVAWTGDREPGDALALIDRVRGAR